MNPGQSTPGAAGSNDRLLQPLALPCGQVLPNRLAKAAMTERLSGRDYAPNALHEALYRLWGESGPAGPAGLLMTGNMLVDHRYLESAGNIAPLVGEQRAALERMAEAARSGGSRVWVQLNHAGRQTTRFNNLRPVSASDVGLNKLGFFGRPRPLRAEEIEGLIQAYVRCGRLLQDCGFEGLQVHAAHGYLLSQFLSPLTNRRSDRWGGSLENRARLLLDIVRALRQACGPDLALSVKINSADFQRGGFEEEDSLQVIAWLEREGIDLLEISGGNYERLVFFQKDSERLRASTREREAYFGVFARQVKAATRVPVMLTGGLRSREGCLAALERGEADVIGLARAFLVERHFAPRFLAGEIQSVSVPSVRLGLRHADDLAEAGYWDAQIDRLARGLEPEVAMSPGRGFLHLLGREAGKALAKRLAGAG